MNSSSPETLLKAPPLSFLSLRARLGLGFGGGIAAVLVIALSTLLAARFSASQETLLQQYNRDLVLIQGFARSAVRLQLAASRYLYLGYPSALHEAEATFARTVERCAPGAGDCSLERHGVDFPELFEHLHTYYDSFQAVAESRQTIVTGLAEDFAALRELLGIPDGDDALRELHRAGNGNQMLQDHLLAMESELRLYFLAFDPEHLQVAQRQVEDIREHHLQGADGVTSDPAVIRQLAETVSARIQQLRGYSYLVNVVMSSEAYEIMFLSNQAAGDVEASIRELETTIDSARQRFFLYLGIGTALVALLASVMFILVWRSISLPLVQLSETFQRLARGDEGEIRVPTRRRDEIGRLVDAARAFRTENIRAHQLLRDYQALNETLEDQVAVRTRQLKQKNDELSRIAATDTLTGMANRRVLDQTLAFELERAQRYDRSLAVLMMDIDHFKQINDNRGHLTGDRVLEALGDLLSANVRRADLVGRWGGEEFMVLCPETSLDNAATLAEKIRRAVAATEFPAGVCMTISVGVAVNRREDTPELLVARADRALYRAKTTGRDRVCLEDDAAA